VAHPLPHRATRRSAWSSVLLAALATASIVLAACAPSRPETLDLPTIGPVRRAEVIAVVDGDTVELRIGAAVERVRLLGVDTPETVHPDRPVECWGPEASARTKALLPPGTAVVVQRDREARDRYGRLLAYLWRASDRLFVNEALLSEGAGEALIIAPNTSRRRQLTEAARAARAARVGRWGSCPASDGER
jgi:micrococcal nuclease